MWLWPSCRTVCVKAAPHAHWYVYTVAIGSEFHGPRPGRKSNFLAIGLASARPHCVQGCGGGAFCTGVYVWLLRGANNDDRKP